jgi:hypothetical protein
MWTSRPHHGFDGCNITANQKCGDEPELLLGHAKDWPAVSKWTLPFLQRTTAQGATPQAQVHTPENLENRQSAPPAIEGSTFAVGTCARADHVYVVVCLALLRLLQRCEALLKQPAPT